MEGVNKESTDIFFEPGQNAFFDEDGEITQKGEDVWDAFTPKAYDKADKGLFTNIFTSMFVLPVKAIGLVVDSAINLTFGTVDDVIKILSGQATAAT